MIQTSISARTSLLGPTAGAAAFAILLGGLSACGPSGSSGGASLVLRNGTVWSDGLPAGATAVAIADDTIAAIGTEAEIEPWIGPGTEVVDAGGGTIGPGFIDSHVHFLEGGYRLTSVQLRDASTPEEFTSRIAAFAETQPEGTWITGGDWDHTTWGGELPRAQWIDAVTPDHPVMVNRLDGHMVLVNTAAMRLAGLDASTPDVDGGEIVRDAAGNPTGILRDNAMSLVSSVVPTSTVAADDAALDAAMAYVGSNGVTSVVHMGTFADLEVFRRARAEGRLTTRITACTPLAQWERLARLVEAEGRGDEWLSWGCLKGFVDGSLGSHTAAFYEPFTDAPDDRGFFVETPEHLYEWSAAAGAAGLQVDVHAIGDRAIGTLLDIFERIESEAGPRDRRFRIEHAQHLRPSDIPRFAELGVVASMQPYHAIDDGRWAEGVIGAERSLTTYAFRSLLDDGAVLAFGSDWFVAPPTPLEGLYAAVTRRTLDGSNPDGWVPSQKISLEESLRAYTTGGAYATFDEARKGVLEPGRLADVVVIDRDLFGVDPASLRDAHIRATIVGGRVVAGGG